VSDEKKSKAPEATPAAGLNNEQLLVLINTLQQGQKEMLKEVLAESRKPSVLEERKLKEEEAARAKIEANRKKMRESQAEMVAEIQERQDNCPHLKEDGTSAIAWHTYYNGTQPVATLGCCQHCNRLIKQTDSDFLMLAKIPQRRAYA
jgi:hypothetical protein